MQPGDVLVARMTTPAWTTLFAMAAAVVTDVGGPLSHSSIVAREYGIPAVLGTGVATHNLPDGQLVRVDGDAGTVTVLDQTGYAAVEPQRPTRPAPTLTGATRSATRTITLAAVGGLGALVLFKMRRRARGGGHTHRQRDRWSTSRAFRGRPVLVVAGLFAHAVLTMLVWRDIDRRGPSELRGSKALWRFLTALNTGNHLLYLLAGRRRGSSADP
jgi:phosphohistidine swiveling domain-containing protein